MIVDHDVFFFSINKVLLAEDLQEILNLKFANGAANKAWRRHKFEQIERLHAQKVRAARQIFAKSAQEAVKWFSLVL